MTLANFQFYHRAIETLVIIVADSVGVIFQFYHRAIETFSAGSVRRVYTDFQFYHRAIETGMEYGISRP